MEESLNFVKPRGMMTVKSMTIYIVALGILFFIFDNITQLDLGCVHTIPDGFLCQHQKVIRYSMNSNDTELEQVVHTH